MQEEEKRENESKPQKSKLKKFVDEKNITKKKIIKVATVIMAIALIVFSTISNAIIDPENLVFTKWLTNSLILVAIMVFGLFMGESIGEDEQKEKLKGLYQSAINDYLAVYNAIKAIKIYFSTFFIWYKERELKQAKIDFLMDNEIDGRWAKICVSYLEKSDFEVGKFIFDSNKPTEKVYCKEIGKKQTIMIHKATPEQAELIKQMFNVRIETYGYSYYLSYTESDIKGGNLKKAIPLNKKLFNNKLFNRALKIVSTLFISFIWGMMTTNEFQNEAERKQAWFLLISRITCLATSIISGWSSAVVSVKIQANIINNKKDVLNDFKDSVDSGLFIPETYDDMVERELKEQKQSLPEEQQAENVQESNE